MASTKHSQLLIWSGSLLIGAALCILLWGGLDEQRAARSAQTALAELEAVEMPAAPVKEPRHPEASAALEDPEPPADFPAPEREMPVTAVDGVDYLGKLEVPALELALPIISQWSNSLLKVAPCRYAGSVYRDDMILAGHNYRAHFSRLKELQVGDAVIFTDVEGNRFYYTVSRFEELPGTAVQEMESGEWDLTLFTCTAGGKARLTVRCVREAAQENTH